MKKIRYILALGMCLAMLHSITSRTKAFQDASTPKKPPTADASRSEIFQSEISQPETQQDKPILRRDRSDIYALTNSGPDRQTMWEFARDYTGSDKIARILNSFANGHIMTDGQSGSSCSGVLISPHIFMSAGHCGGVERMANVYFFRIDEDSPNPSNSTSVVSPAYEAISLSWMTFDDFSDIVLWYLQDGPDGIPPGIRYGYIELSTESVEPGDQAYSFWWNPVDNLGSGGPLVDVDNTLLHSFGPATGPTAPYHTGYNMYGIGGASGSAIIGTGRHNHRIIGVTSGAPQDGGLHRTVSDTSVLLEYHDSGNPANYGHKNDVTDAIEYDLLFTRAPRNFYHLRFDTPLQRELWRLGESRGNGTTGTRHDTNPGTTGTVVGSLSRSINDCLWHSTVKFLPNTRYRISMVVRGNSVDANPAYLKFISNTNAQDIYIDFQPTVNQWKRLTFQIQIPNNPDYRLVLGDRYEGSYSVDDVAIIREPIQTNPPANLNFETNDERRSWEYVGGSYVTSFGINGSTDFSGMVVGPSPSGTWSLRNRYVALRANQTYDITFTTKHVSGSLCTQFMRVENLAGVTATMPVTTWCFAGVGATDTRTVTVSTGNEQGHTLVFGSINNSKYMADNIQIRER